MLTNADVAELLRQAAQDEQRDHRRRALDRAGRAALFWPVEISAMVESDQDLTSLPAVGPWVEAKIRRWLEDDVEPPEPEEIRRDFLTLARVRVVLAESAGWVEGLQADLQMHTTWSDGATSLRTMAEAVDAAGYRFAAITDHSKSLRIARGMSEEELARQGLEIRALNRELQDSGSDLQLLRSIEMDVFADGSGDMDPAALRELDLVLGAFHTKLRDETDQTERYLAALRNPDVHVLAHPRARKFGRRLGLTADWPRVFAEAAALDKALEIDASPDRQDLNVELLRLARDVGVRISIGTDAHQPAELAFMEFGLAAAILTDIPKERILNFASREGVLAWASRPELTRAAPAAPPAGSASRIPGLRRSLLRWRRGRREVAMHIDTFEMERMQSLYWHEVEYDLSESGVQPLTIRELLGDHGDPQGFLDTALGYPLSEGSDVARERIAQWYPGCRKENVTIVNGGSEANFLTLWTLLEPGDRLAFMIPNYLQGWGLGRHFAGRTDTFGLRLRERQDPPRWELDPDELERAVTDRTRAIMVCNPNNPTGHVLTQPEMEAIIEAASRVGAWIVADEIYRGAEIDTDEASPTFWGRYDRVVITSGLSKAFGMPGLRIGWAVAAEETIGRIWIRHDYTTLTPGMVSDELAGVAMDPERRERILGRTREIIRRQLPPLEEWIHSHDDVFHYARPAAGAIAYVTYDLPQRSMELIDRIRTEQSVLLVPGDVFGLDKGIRIGFGYDIEHTLKGLARVDEVLAASG